MGEFKMKQMSLLTDPSSPLRTRESHSITPYFFTIFCLQCQKTIMPGMFKKKQMKLREKKIQENCIIQDPGKNTSVTRI